MARVPHNGKTSQPPNGADGKEKMRASSNKTLKLADLNKSLIPVPTDYQSKYLQLTRKNHSLARENALLKDKFQRLKQDKTTSTAISFRTNMLTTSVLKNIQNLMAKFYQDMEQLSQVMEDACKLQDMGDGQRAIKRLEQEDVDQHRRMSFERVRAEFKKRFEMSTILETLETSWPSTPLQTNATGTTQRLSTSSTITYTVKSTVDPEAPDIYEFKDDQFDDPVVVPYPTSSSTSLMGTDLSNAATERPLEKAPGKESTESKPKKKVRETLKKKPKTSKTKDIKTTSETQIEEPQEDAGLRRSQRKRQTAPKYEEIEEHRPKVQSRGRKGRDL